MAEFVTREELQWLEELVDDAEKCSRLSKWEYKFISSMREKINEYGVRSHLSDKQMEHLKEIEHKVHRT